MISAFAHQHAEIKWLISEVLRTKLRKKKGVHATEMRSKRAWDGFRGKEQMPGKRSSGEAELHEVGWRSPRMRQQLKESIAQCCGSHQRFPKDPDQFLQNRGFYIKLRVSTTSYLSLQRAPSSGVQSEDEPVNDPREV